jgi:SAM-dependent methyltransferase
MDLIQEVRRYYHTVAPFLDAELADRGDEEFWHSYGRGHVLELGCGSGRVTRWLVGPDGWVLGIDVCPELLYRARTVRAALALADMRRLPLRTSFDTIVAADDPFSHLTQDEDRERALAEVARCLGPGGRFVLDALWFVEPGERQSTREVGLGSRRVHVTEHWRCDAHTHCCTTEYRYEIGRGEPQRARFEARYWTPAELRERFDSAGMRITQWWGGYDRRPWDEHSSERLIVEASPVRGR